MTRIKEIMRKEKRRCIIFYITELKTRTVAAITATLNSQTLKYDCG
jgi:hypothetical protein